MKRQRFYQILFLVAGIYNILWGSWVSVDLQWLFRFAKMEMLNYPEFFVSVGMVVGLFGLVYLEIARWPDARLFARTGRIYRQNFGPVRYFLLHLHRQMEFFRIMNLTNDFVRLNPFAVYLYDSFLYFRKDSSEQL